MSNWEIIFSDKGFPQATKISSKINFERKTKIMNPLSNMSSSSLQWDRSHIETAVKRGGALSTWGHVKFPL